MRVKATWLVVGVVAAIAIAAGVDALRDEPARSGTPPETTGQEPTTGSTTSGGGEAQAPDGPAGVLYYTDAECGLQAVRLPDDGPADAPGWDECRFVLSPDGRRVAREGSGWDPHSDPLRGRLFQSDATTITISTNGGPEDVFKGNAPAWRPDGALTYFANGAVREWPSGDVVLSQRDLMRALRGPFPEVSPRDNRLSVREAAWLDDRRFAAIFSAEGPELGEITGGSSSDMLAIYDGTELVGLTFDAAGGLSDLRVSPQGRYAAATSTGGRDTPGGFVLLESGGRELLPPRISGFRALAWSPDEQWLAVAADRGVLVYRAGVPGPPTLELDVDAQDLAWRGPAGPAPLASVDRTRSWLGGVGVAGRLFVTQSEGQHCVLRALQISDLAWADEPAGPPTPCRFRLDPDDGSAVGETTVPQPGGTETASCQGEGVDVFDGTAYTRYEGACAPAWMPDGTLTFVKDGGLYARERPLLTREKLSRIMGRPSALEEVEWLDDERFWAVVRSGESAIVALLTTDRLVFSPSFTARVIEGLRASATGMVAARTDQGVVLFDSGGRRAMSFPNGQGVAWAPGELIAAVATPAEVLFVAPVSREVVSVPLAVRDLEWVVP